MVTRTRNSAAPPQAPQPNGFPSVLSKVQSEESELLSREKASLDSALSRAQTFTLHTSSTSPIPTVPASATTEQSAGPSARPSLTAPPSATQTSTPISSSSSLQVSSTGHSIEPISPTSQLPSTATGKPIAKLSLGGIVGVVVSISWQLALEYWYSRLDVGDGAGGQTLTLQRCLHSCNW
ncbi:hypothetical protein FB451DRAFT_1406331 [Mycena latifolia]|nr:hypothetical protein FB451DRAFT_1406331 [Mycena latifolia]